MSSSSLLVSAKTFVKLFVELFDIFTGVDIDLALAASLIFK
jgi:hypothetical protein